MSSGIPGPKAERALRSSPEAPELDTRAGSDPRSAMGASVPSTERAATIIARSVRATPPMISLTPCKTPVGLCRGPRKGADPVTNVLSTRVWVHADPKPTAPARLEQSPMSVESSIAAALLRPSQASNCPPPRGRPYVGSRRKEGLGLDQLVHMHRTGRFREARADGPFVCLSFFLSLIGLVCKLVYTFYR